MEHGGLRSMLDVTPRYESCSRDRGRASKKLATIHGLTW
jgi:hypothetical protein